METHAHIVDKQSWFLSVVSQKHTLRQHQEVHPLRQHQGDVALMQMKNSEVNNWSVHLVTQVLAECYPTSAPAVPS